MGEAPAYRWFSETWDAAQMPAEAPAAMLMPRLNEHTNYIARSLLETGGFRPQLLHPGLG